MCSLASSPSLQAPPPRGSSSRCRPPGQPPAWLHPPSCPLPHRSLQCLPCWLLSCPRHPRWQASEPRPRPPNKSPGGAPTAPLMRHFEPCPLPILWHGGTAQQGVNKRSPLVFWHAAMPLPPSLLPRRSFAFLSRPPSLLPRGAPPPLSPQLIACPPISDPWAGRHKAAPRQLPHPCWRFSVGLRSILMHRP